MSDFDPHDLLTTGGITAGIAVLSFLGLIVKQVFSAASKIAILIEEVKQIAELRRSIDVTNERVNTLWGFLLSRGIAEAVTKGVATMNSPITVTEEAKAWFEPIVAQLRTFYDGEGRGLSDVNLAIEIERRFGDRILKEICIPHGLFMGACLVIALQLLRDNAPSIAEIYPYGADRRIEDRGPPAGMPERRK